MKKLFAFVLLSLMSIQAQAAVIVGENYEGLPVSVWLNAEGKVASDTGITTIKDFGISDSIIINPCYKGTETEVRNLLEQLVSAADGDGDSWSELHGIRCARNKTLTVSFTITDEGGEHKEEVRVPRCNVTL